MITERTIQLVRTRTDLVALIGESVKLIRRGRSWVGLCPFHKEKSPSFHVSPERGYFHCFGCQESGNAISFVMKLEALTFPDAVRRLAERAGIEIEENATEQERREEASARRSRDDLAQACNLAAMFYEKMLNEHPSARVAHEELEKRGLVPTSPTDPIATALQAFRIGYAPPGWDELARYLQQQGISPAAADKAGLLIPRATGGGYYDRFRNRLMFAVIDVQGRTVAFSGRILPDPQTGIVDKETGKYINSPETAIYRKSQTVFGLYQAKRAIRQIEEAVLVEGNFDVVSLHARGIENVIAPLGTAFTLEQAQLIKRFTPTVTLLFDGDAAGQKAIKAAREPCFKAGLMAKAATLPDGADPDDLVRTRGVDAMRAVIKASKGLLEFMIESILDVSYVRGDASERQARAREINALLNSEDDPTVRAMARRYADEVARRLGLVNDKLVDSQMGMIDRTTFDALSRSVEQALAPKPESRERAPKVDRDHLAEAVLGCLIDFPSLLEDPDVAGRLEFLEGDAVFVVSALQQAIASEADDGAVSLDADKVLALVPASFHAFARHRLAAPVHLEPDTARSELLANAEKLKRRVYSRENAAVEREAARAEAMGSDEEALALLIEATRRAKSRRSPS